MIPFEVVADESREAVGAEVDTSILSKGGELIDEVEG